MPHIPPRLKTVFGKNGKTDFNDSFSVRTIKPSADDRISERQTVPIHTHACCESLSPSPEQNDHPTQSFLPYPAYDQRYAYPDVNKNKEQEGGEEEKEEIAEEIRELRTLDVKSTERSLQTAQRAVQTGRRTLGDLEEQGYRLQNIEANVEQTNILNKVGAENLRVLKATQMIPNPFEARQRTVEGSSGIVRFEHNSRANSTKPGCPEFIEASWSLAERAKYKFEDGDTDDEDEKKIGENLGAISEIVKELRDLASDLGQELEKQNGELRGIEEKVDTVTDGLNMNKHRMNRYS
jgi:synaptosomal-associated protein 25